MLTLNRTNTSHVIRLLPKRSTRRTIQHPHNLAANRRVGLLGNSSSNHARFRDRIDSHGGDSLVRCRLQHHHVRDPPHEPLLRGSAQAPRPLAFGRRTRTRTRSQPRPQPLARRSTRTLARRIAWSLARYAQIHERLRSCPSHQRQLHLRVE